MSFYSIVPAGGIGSRLWPISRENNPKFLLDLTDDNASLLQQTIKRLESFSKKTYVVTGAKHALKVLEQIKESNMSNSTSVIIEPSSKGTMGAIGIACSLIELIDKDAVVGSFASDHAILNSYSFHEAVKEAIELAKAN